jgi:hypothetical protein
MSDYEEKQEDPKVKTPSGNPDQKWIQSDSFRFDSYEEASVKLATIEAERKRIRARAKGKFDVVVFKPFTAKA